MISYDSNLLIYFLESHPEFGQTAREILLSHSNSGVVLSTLVIQEVLTGFALRGDNSEATARRMLDTLEYTEFVPVSKQITEEAVRLTVKYGRKILGYDSIHLATSIVSGGNVFYTNDKQLLSAGVEEVNIRAIEKI